MQFTIFVSFIEKLALNKPHVFTSTKTKVMIFGRKLKLNNQSMSIEFKGTTLENVDKIKYPGVILDSQLNWSYYISYVSNKISRSIGCIRRIKYVLSSKQLTNLYHALILSYIRTVVRHGGIALIQI